MISHFEAQDLEKFVEEVLIEILNTLILSEKLYSPTPTWQSESRQF